MAPRKIQKTRQLQKSNKFKANEALSKEKISTDRKILRKVAKNAVNKVIKNAAKQRQYIIKDEEDMEAPYRIEKILDSKQDMNGLMFLVQFTGDGQTGTSWIRERELGSRDLLLQYHQEHPNLETTITSDNLYSNSRSRASKTRAKLLLQHDALFHDEQRKPTQKRASVKSTKRTADDFNEGAEKPGKGSKKKSVRAVKAEQLKEERDNRIKSFEATLPHFSFNISKPHSKSLDCCSTCSAREYSRAIANNDKKLLFELCKDEKLVPSWKLDENPNTPFQSPFVDAVLSGKTEFVELMLEADKNPRGPPVKNAESFNTGFVSKTAFGSYARPVKESRGNRRGNQAFYSQADKPPLEVQQARSYTLGHILNRALLSIMQNPSISATMIDYLYLKCNEANSCLMTWGTYEAIAAGNRAVACNIVNAVGETAGFNKVHMAVLKLNGDQLLPSYRKNQILKKALDNHNLTPLACAAIHPKSTYLAELFEQLDAVGQGFTDSYGRTVAHFAAASETSDCLQYLISKGFNCMQLDKTQSSPLTLAAKYGRSHNVELLLEMLTSNTNGESTKIADTTMLTQKWTPLHYAAYYGRPETCSMLIKYGASVGSQDSKTKSTPLHFAATQGNTECIRALIEEGKADVDIIDKYGSTALHMACKNGQYDSVVTLLSFGADANAEDTSGNCPLHHAAAYGWLSIVKLLVEATDCQANPSNLWKTTPCGIANRKGHSKVVRFFLETKAKKFDINFKDNNGRTMLHHCLEERISSEYEAEQLIQKVIHLLKCGANPNSQDIDGSTPLHVLSKDSQFAQDRPLGYPTQLHWQCVEFGTNGNIEGYPKLDYDDENGALVQEKIINTLIKAGADPEMEDAGGETPMAVAMSEGNNHVVQYLLQHGASPLTSTAAGDNIFHYLLASFKKTDMAVWTDLDNVIKGRLANRRQKIWGLLITKYASKTSDLKSLVNAINNKGYTPILWGLHVAINTQKEHVKKIIKTSSIIPMHFPWIQQSNPVQTSDIRYHFEKWAQFASLFIRHFEPNMNTVRKLEKDFLVKNPKAKASDYPKGTGMGLLHHAAELNKPILIELFLKHGCDANLKAAALDNYRTPIMISAVLKPINFSAITNKTTEDMEKLKSSFNILYPELQQDWLQSCKLLLEYGAQPFEFHAESDSAAMIAARQKSQDVLLHMIALAHNKKMQQHGINNVNKGNESILMVALDTFGKELKKKHENSEKYNKALASLLQVGANANQKDKKSSSALMRAIQYGVHSIVKTLMSCTTQSIDFSICNDESENALIIACRQLDAQLALLVLRYMPNNSSRKVVVCQMDNSGNTALSLSSKMGCPTLIEMLLSYGAEPNNHSSTEIPLINAVKSICTASMRHLISCNANTDVKDKNGDSALHHAVRTEKVEIVKLLLEAGAHVNAVNTFQQSPLHLAIHHSKKQINTSLRIEKALLDCGAHINAVDILGRTALHTVFVDLNFVPDMHYTRPIKERVIRTQEIEARKRKTYSIVAEFALKYGTKSTSSWLSEGRERKVNKSIEFKKQDSGETTLPLSNVEELRQFGRATWENPESHGMEKSDRIDIFGFLLKQFALELNNRDSFGRTAMHYAASVGAFTCTSQMLDKGAEVNMQDNDQNIPVNVALKYNHVDYAVMISQRGANLRSDIYLADGTSKSIFEYSLSKDYINLGYFVVEKDASPQKYVYDALKTGKFHIASLLLNSASEPILRSHNVDKQTFFHLITAFKPFDYEIYEEYGNEFFNLLIRFGTAFNTLDSYGRSPLHWACKFNHANLVKRLLSLGIPFNIKDKEGKSELWYAVQAQNAEITKLLIDHGASINSDSQELPSVILVATMKRNLKLVELLIENGASLQADDGQNRPNAVMQAVVDQNIEVLEVLLKAGALPNISSIFKEKADGKERSTLIAPLLIACIKNSDRIFELLVDYNADVNVLAPINFEPLNGQSPLMYSLFKKNFNRIKMLFNCDADVNQVNPLWRRSTFYSFLLDKMDEHWLEFMWNQRPIVNIIDDITCQTPLEFAIRQSDQKLLERLLEHGGDINVVSCRSSKTAAQLYHDSVPALFHAVLNNNTSAVELILSHPLCKNKVDWKFRDQFGRNVITRCVQCFSSYSYQNDDMLRYLITASGSLAKFLMNEKDEDGKRAIDYAANHSTMNMYNVLIEYGSAHSMASNDDSMDVDTEFEFQTVPVEEDAIKARELLMKKAEEERIKKGEVAEEKKIEIDPNSELQDVGSIVYESGEPLDIMLHRTDVAASQWGLNMFYKMSLIYNKLLDMDILWTRWGAIGQTGAFQKTPIPGRTAAVAEFKKLFKSKSGNLWDTRMTDFTSKPGRFNMVKDSPYKDLPTLTELDLTKPTVPSQLSSSIQDFLKLCVNFKHLESAKNDIQMGLPLGQLSEKTLGEAGRILNQVDQILYELEVLNTSIGGMHDVQRMKELYHRLALLSNDYYLLIPKSTDSTYGIRPLSTRAILREEQGRLSNLKYFNYTANVLMAAQHRNDEMNPLDYVHRSLECDIQELSPKTGHEELYNAISKYMQETGAGPSGEHYDLLHLFSVDRKGEAAGYQPFSTNENRMLLWHGSKISNFIGILKQGLRIKPGQAYETGSMFGSGLYFADMFSKSSGYCNDYTSVDAQPYSLMLLCEVALGKTYDLVSAKDMDRNEEDHLSTKGLGQQGPNPKMFIKGQRGVTIPQGPVISFEDITNNRVGNIGRANANLMHNEYIVYDPAQVRIKYLLVVQNNRYCPVCAAQQAPKSMNRLQNYSFKSDMYKHKMTICNEYESAVIEMQMYHQNTDTEEIFQKSMKGDLSFLESSECGATKITTAMKLKNTSYVCYSCAQGIKDRILVNWYKGSQAEIPDAITEREDCKWGFECTTQKYKLEHAKAYNHLCPKRAEK